MVKIKIYRADSDKKWVVEEKDGDTVIEYRSGSRAKALLRLFMRHPGITVFYLSFAKNNEGKT